MAGMSHHLYERHSLLQSVEFRLLPDTSHNTNVIDVAAKPSPNRNHRIEMTPSACRYVDRFTLIQQEDEVRGERDAKWLNLVSTAEAEIQTWRHSIAHFSSSGRDRSDAENDSPCSPKSPPTQLPTRHLELSTLAQELKSCMEVHLGLFACGYPAKALCLRLLSAFAAAIPALAAMPNGFAYGFTCALKWRASFDVAMQSPNSLTSDIRRLCPDVAVRMMIVELDEAMLGQARRVFDMSGGRYSFRKELDMYNQVTGDEIPKEDAAQSNLRDLTLIARATFQRTLNFFDDTVLQRILTNVQNKLPAEIWAMIASKLPHETKLNINALAGANLVNAYRPRTQPDPQDAHGVANDLVWVPLLRSFIELKEPPASREYRCADCCGRTTYRLLQKEEPQEALPFDGIFADGCRVRLHFDGSACSQHPIGMLNVDVSRFSTDHP